MTTPRIYFPRLLEPGDEIELDENDSHYLRNVLRLKSGEAVKLFGTAEFEYDSVVVDAAAKPLKIKVVDKVAASRDEALKITLAQSLPKMDKMDLIVQKATELGASAIVPFVSSRSVPVLTPPKAKQRRERWQKIALEAAKQCRRPDVPEVGPVVAFDEMLEIPAADSFKIIFWEEEGGTTIKCLLKSRPSERNLFIVIGPEGGFSAEEVEHAKGRGFVSVSLGKQVLKTETAGMTVLSIIQYERGIFSAE